MPLLFQMTVCVDIRVVVPGAWVAFSYSSVHAPRPELGLEGDDNALYGWLLRVRHRFPLRLSPTHWHRVCLRRDVLHNSFSLEVDGQMVAERTVIAQAIPPSGSLWLGCRPRDRSSGAKLGQVELYLFRMWADLGDHGLCEDGTVIGWDARYWGVTSPNARHRDPYLLCEVPSTTSGPVIATPDSHMSNQTSVATAAITSHAISASASVSPSFTQVSGVFGCGGNQIDLKDFCHGGKNLKVVEVSCGEENTRNTTCSVLLQLSHAVSACDLQRAGVYALQQAETIDNQFRARIIGEVERVGRNLCEDLKSGDGNFVRCTSTSSLDDICQSNTHSKLRCSLIDLKHPDPAPEPKTESCSRETPRFCDCTAFCNSAMMCGSPGLPVTTLLASNLTWVASDLLTSDVCESDPTLLKCEANETLAVLLTDSCSPEPPTTKQSTTQPSTTTNINITPTSEALPPSVTNKIQQTNMTTVAQMVGQLENLLDGPTVSQEVGQKAINIISNLMEGDSAALSASAKRLIQLVDNLGVKLVVSGDRGILSSNSLVLAVRTVDATNFPTTSVNIFNTDNVQLRALSRSRSKRSDSALGSVFLPSSLTAGLSPEEQQQASRVQFTFYTKNVFFQDVALDNNTLVSPVLGSSVANLSISNLTENIQFTIRNINPIDAESVVCSFWDFTLNGGGGGWSSAGCFVVNATPEETICSCNHLTSFAILLDLSREGITDRQHAQILTFITYIGCGISAIFLAVTLLTYLSFEKLLRDIPAKILVQLCMSLLFLNLVFLLDGWLALYPAIGLCISTAFFLHYFLLTSFTWAGLEALHMYLSIVQVFTPYLSRYMLKFSLMGWGIPLIIVIIIISVDKDNYGLVTYGRYTDGTSDDFCWLRNDIAFYVGVVAYFLLIFSLCLLVFIVVMVQLARIKKQNPQNQSPNRGVMTDLRSIAGLIILLGLTWGFALFAWGPLYLPFVYLFSILNSLQGECPQAVEDLSLLRETATG
ncbi:adhesion G-protein coupled receptor G2 isoform X4 [Lates japonicus]|uniref:Adhesion G-protein coupled receptor G2 n=1 Tax=Lates japonicus TaxID=270547 RepID=A0AAD3NDC1_LATJO|nr:adhesion G-protein coupled receptor G2 isoform X4 [Lates japonicus]GLD69169.1 adhesion G-protein coupled receptor G2 isoform X4 [Lates japonicus]